MKIKFEEYDLTEFLIKDGVFCGNYSKLITPNHVGTKFTQKNKIFRSSIWSNIGLLLSAGLPKFVNFLENPENFPVPLTIDNCSFVEKIDGSLCCIDFVDNQISTRTRGTFSVETMENKSDFDYCLSKYPKIIDWLKQNNYYTLLCEITTPNLRVVLDYGYEPDFWLVGAVDKNDYSLMTQYDLDKLGKELGLRRPESFSFNSIEELLSKVGNWTSKEGVCLYSKNSQEIHKIKANSYLKLHRFKENATLENTLELFMEYGCPSYKDFEIKLQTQFDFECWNMIRGFASNICDAWKEVQKIIGGFNDFVEKVLRPLQTRRDQAAKVLASYGNSSRTSFVFKMLDSKQLSDEDLKKLFWQILKK
jgi:hypothetical protein